MINVLVLNYNNASWIERCLDSVKEQTAEARVLVVDDASTDDSWTRIKAYLRQKDWSGVRNDVNVKAEENLWDGIQHLAPEPNDVIYLLDGDDFIPHAGVLKRIEEIFSDDDVWLTYGNYDVHPYDTGQAPASAYSDDVIRTRSFRATGRQLFNHPLVFRSFLWDGLEERDLQDHTGEWFRNGYDKVIMLPLLELATGQQDGPHFRFIDEILYTYNSVNPLSEVYSNPDTRCLEVWKRPPKAPLRK